MRGKPLCLEQRTPTCGDTASGFCTVDGVKIRSRGGESVGSGMRRIYEASLFTRVVSMTLDYRPSGPDGARAQRVVQQQKSNRKL